LDNFFCTNKPLNKCEIKSVRKFVSLYFLIFVFISGFKISLFRVYFHRFIWLCKLFFRESIAAALSASRFPLVRNTASTFFLYVKFKERRLTKAEIWIHTHVSLDVTHVGIANSNGRKKLLVYESAAETHRSNQLKCSVRFRTILRHLPHARRKDMVDGVSIKYATIYAARWVRIYALIPAILCVSNRLRENAAENLSLNAGNLVKIL